MSDLAIRVESLSKRYRLGECERYRTLRDAIARRFSAPFHRTHSTLQRAHDKQTFWALKDVSLEVKQGEVLGIIGRNRAGKSTLLKILSCITEPRGGYAKIQGQMIFVLKVDANGF